MCPKLLGALALLFLAPAAAQADVRTTSGEDPAGDGSPAYVDMRYVAARYDSSGSIRFDVTVSEPVTTAKDVFFLAQVDSGPGCGEPKLRLASQVFADIRAMTLGTAEIARPTLERLSEPGPVPGTVYRLSGVDPPLAGQAFTCFEIWTFPHDAPESDGPSDVYKGNFADGGAPAPCRISASSVSRGDALGLRCEDVSGRVTARFKRRGKPGRTVTVRIDGSGRARLGTRRFARGRYRVTILQDGRRIGTRTVRVR